MIHLLFGLMTIAFAAYESAPQGISLHHLATFKSPLTHHQPEQGTSRIQMVAVTGAEHMIFSAGILAGERAEGVLQALDLSRPRYPKKIAERNFRGTEFSEITVNGNYLYASGVSTNRDGILQAAVMSFDWTQGFKVMDRHLLPGRAATSIRREGDTVYVSSATDGGVSRFKVEPNGLLTPRDFIPHSNALDLGWVGGSHFMVLGGQNSTVITPLLSPSQWLEPVLNYVIESPARMVSKPGWLITNAGDRIQGRRLQNWPEQPATPWFDVPAPGRGNGLAVKDITPQGDTYVFGAQGDAGLWVLRVPRTGNPEWVGNFDFSNDPGSANSVWIQTYRGRSILALADGSSGTHLIQTTLKRP